MTRLQYGAEELLRSHDYARPQIEAGHLLHGGFDTTLINLDPHRVVPLDVTRELEREGAIGSLFDELFTTTGNTSVIPDMRRFAREMAEALKEAGVEGVILTTT